MHAFESGSTVYIALARNTTIDCPNCKGQPLLSADGSLYICAVCHGTRKIAVVLHEPYKCTIYQTHYNGGDGIIYYSVDIQNVDGATDIEDLHIPYIKDVFATYDEAKATADKHNEKTNEELQRYLKRRKRKYTKDLTPVSCVVTTKRS